MVTTKAQQAEVAKLQVELLRAELAPAQAEVAADASGDFVMLDATPDSGEEAPRLDDIDSGDDTKGTFARNNRGAGDIAPCCASFPSLPTAHGAAWLAPSALTTESGAGPLSMSRPLDDSYSCRLDDARALASRCCHDDDGDAMCDG